MVATLDSLLSSLDLADAEVAGAIAHAVRSDPKLRQWYQTKQTFYAQFRPRPNRPELFDEQQAFMDCMSTGVIFLIGGNAAGTTTCALMKAIRFMLEQQPPPRKDTPFWIISSSYESTIKTAWKEKIAEKKMIPDCEIDHGRMIWYNSTAGLPMSVPLKPWPTSRGGDPNKNWCIEFKSYEQGREQLQARSIGGFVMMEQFPYEILQEVLRGCRDYNFPGSKLCEFTPIDPVLSAEIEDMDVNGKLPDTWRIFRCNTECNKELAEGWIDEFVAQMSDEMRETRLTGAWGTYVGCIYAGFNAAVHVVDLPRTLYGGIQFPANVYHLRGTDWGSSPEHPFATLWAYRDGLGAYWFYDEYWNDSQTATVWDHADAIKSRQRWVDGDPHYGPMYADPSRPDMFNNFAQLGIAVHPARNDVLDGIESVRRKLKVQESTGLPLLFVDRGNCPRLIAEMRRYRWMKSKPTGLNPHAARAQPLKRADDLCDAQRYLIHTDSLSIAGGAIGLHVPVDPSRHGVQFTGAGADGARRDREWGRSRSVHGDGHAANGFNGGGGDGRGGLSSRILPRK